MEDVVIINRQLDAPPSKVWLALTEPDEMRKWYFPMLEDFVPTPGFETKFTVSYGGKYFLHHWKITEVRYLQKISYEWRYGGYPGSTLLEFALKPSDSGTLLNLKHSGLLSFDPNSNPELSSVNFMQGWNGFMDALREHLSRYDA